MKNVIFFVVGVGLGAGIGVLASRGHYRKLAFDEINEARETFRKMAASKDLADKNSREKADFLKKQDEKTGKNDTKLVKLTGNSEKEDESDDILDDSETEKVRNRVQKREEMRQYDSLRGRYIRNYNVFSNPPKASEIDNENDSDEVEEADDPYDLIVDHEYPDEDSNGYSLPYRISEEEFASEKLFYDKVIINYYMDGIGVYDDTDQIVEDLEDLIGPDILNEKTGNEDLDDTDTIYVRNNSRGTDYGIIFMDSEFLQEEDSD